MQLKHAFVISVVLVCLGSARIACGQQLPPTADFTYTGYIEQGGVPVDGIRNFVFRLYDDPDPFNFDNLIYNTGWVQVQVDNGWYTINLELDPRLYGGEAGEPKQRWLQGWVWPPFAKFPDRIPFTPTSVAMYALDTQRLCGRLVSDDEPGDGDVFRWDEATGCWAPGPGWKTSGNNVFYDTGDVGIGTDAPEETLDVRGTVQMQGFKLPVNPMPGYVLTSDDMGAGAWEEPPSAESGWIVDGEHLISDVPGNVGIGVDSPRYKLDVSGIIAAGTGYGNGRLHLRGGDNGTDTDIIYSQNGMLKWFVGIANNYGDDSLSVVRYPERLDVITITGDRNIGISELRPTNIVTVRRGSATDPIADGWLVYSSRRWKENIETLENALDTVTQLRGVRFDWKVDGKPDLGLVAEEVGQIVPELVEYEDDDQNARSVDYARLVPLLVEAIKEQQREITSLRAEIAEVAERAVARRDIAR